MNENLNLVEILKDCKKGTKLYSPIYGEVEFDKIDIHSDHPIDVLCKYGDDSFTKDGRMFSHYDGECMLFPSRKQRDWSKFKPLKPELNVKNQKFDPKTLHPFDKVLVSYNGIWDCDFYSHYKKDDMLYDDYVPFSYICVSTNVDRVIPYNDDTKHLVGTDEEAPEFYRYWED